MAASSFASFKSAFSILNSMLEFKAAAEFKDKIIELQGIIGAAQADTFAAQERQAALLEEVNKLKSQVAKLRAWDSEKKKYELKELHTGNFAYALKKSEKKGGPVHYLCPACYEGGKKSILQENDMGSHGTVLQCFECKTYVVSRPSAWRNHATKPL